MSEGESADDRTLVADLTELLDEYAAMHRQASQEAARAHGALERVRHVLGQAVHDLRSPLTTIVGLSEILLDDALDEEHRRLVLTIDEAATRMRRLTDGLLTAVEGGHEPKTTAPVDLRDVAKSLVTRHSLLGTAREFVLVDHRLPHQRALVVLGDATKLERLLDNLAGNAVKYSEPGSRITISIVDSITPPSGTSATSAYQVCLTVEDEGIGIPPEELTSVFDAFHRARNAAPVAGVGLGLSIVREIARVHGGEVSATSEPGRGTAFAVVLPAFPPGEAPRDPRTA